MSITVMKQTTDALDEILESFEKDGKFCKSSVIRNELFDKLKTTLEQSKQAIAEAEKQQANERKCDNCGEFGECCQAAKQEPDDLTIAYMSGVYDGKNKYAPQRQWVGLTDEEIAHIYKNMKGFPDVVKAVEAKLKEKNT